VGRVARTWKEGWSVARERISGGGSDRYVAVKECWRGRYDKPWRPGRLIGGMDPTRK
jgi:hypothetical protein